MLLHDFEKDFLEEVRADAATYGVGSCAAFVNLFAKYLQEAESLTDFTSAFFTGTGKRNRKLRVDGYAYDEFDNIMSLIIADYDHPENGRVITKTDVKQLRDRLVYFIEEGQNSLLHSNIEMSMPCTDLVNLLRAKREEIRKYQLLIFTTRKISSSIKNIEPCIIGDLPSDCQVWDIERLFNMCSSSTGRETIQINFKPYSERGIPCLPASAATTGEFKSYLCIIPGTLLADIYDKYGSLLLEGNVRSFLSTKVAVNKKIRSTILNCPHRFFAYNNGISATAMNVDIETTPDGQFIISVTDFQIINGGQTTASISNVRLKDRRDISSIFVQMKLTVIEKKFDEEATELVQNISRSSNSQNKVSDADFFSTHPFHVSMEHFSQTSYAKSTTGAQYDTIWFYERARGQYMQKQMHLTAAERNKFLLQNPKKQLITKTDFAKVQNTWEGFPHIVSKGAQTNFVNFAERIDTAWNDHDEKLKFNKKYFQETVALVILFKFTETMISEQSWYLGGYRANVVTYTLALLHKLIKNQFKKQDLHLMNIWNRQVVPDMLEKVLVELAELVYTQITSSQRSVDNVTQWCKREACWTNIQNIHYSLPADLQNLLIGHEEMRAEALDAKATQELVFELDVQKKVLAISPVEWQKALSFAQNKRLIRNPDENKLLVIAGAYHRKPLTARQCTTLVNLLERLYDEGFKL